MCLKGGVKYAFAACPTSRSSKNWIDPKSKALEVVRKIRDELCQHADGTGRGATLARNSLGADNASLDV
jgi:hypothetical protein